MLFEKLKKSIKKIKIYNTSKKKKLKNSKKR